MRRLRMFVTRSVAIVCFLSHSFAADNKPASADSGIRVQWKSNPTDAKQLMVEILGIPESILLSLTKAQWSSSQWEPLFSIRTESEDLLADINLPPVAGSYEIAGGSVRFTPAFPLTAGVWYRATFHPTALPKSLTHSLPPTSARFRVEPPVLKPSAVVSAVYPSASIVPENLLKFYIQFSAPMSRGHIYDYIQLHDEQGKSVELPFLEIDEELWNGSMTRLTLFLDPGRIKRGVKPLEDIGPSLKSGSRYTLVISKEWRDATGTSLRETFSKSFAVGEPDRKAPDPSRWTLTAPEAGSMEILEVDLLEPLDRALLERMPRVIDAQKRSIEGRVTIGPAERSWRFEPVKPWTAGEYRLQVPTNIEDLAGNNIGKPFDVDLFDRVDRKDPQQTVLLPFHVH